MTQKLIIGQYYPAKSYIHSLDPRIKLVGIFTYITMLFFAQSTISYVFAAACLCIAVYSSTVPPKYMLKGLRSIMFIIIITVTLNLFFTPGENLIFQLWRIRIYSEGVIHSVKMASRLALLIISSSILTLTTSPIALTDAIEYLLRPFKKIGLPAHDIAMMMTIALRFIPTLLEEMDKIMKAQTARGAGFDTGGITKKAKAMIPLLVPLFISAFRRADELATAMEARCYRGDNGRTKMKQLVLSKSDNKAIIFILAFITVIILMRIW